MSDKAVIFGAGAIGRGLLAELVASSGLRPVFVEAVVEFAADLKQRGRYTVHLVGKDTTDVHINNFDTLTLDQADEITQAVSECLFAATAVGGTNLQKTADIMAAGINARKAHLNILVCENYPNADRIVSESLLNKQVCGENFSAIRCSVERMVRKVNASPDLLAESSQTLFIDAANWLGRRVDIAGMNFTDSFDAFYKRKLFTNNAGHALLAYEGYLAGCRYIHQALQIQAISDDLGKLLRSAADVLIQRFNMDSLQMTKHVRELIEWRFSNSELSDPIERVARDPLRKLGSDERLAGLAKLLQQYNLSTDSVAKTIAAAMQYRNQNDPQSLYMGELIEDYGPEHILKNICGFNQHDNVYEETLGFYRNFKKGISHERI